MENLQAALLTLGFLLFLKGCSALVLKPVTDPVISEVGGNVTLEIKPPGVLAAVVWTFSRTGITVVSWTGIKPVIGAGYENRVTLNTATGSLELRSVSLSDAGVYTFGGNTVVSGTLEQLTGSVTLEVYALELTPVTDPVISEVGDSVTLEIKPPGVLAAMVWTFSPAGITVVSLAGSVLVIGAGYENRVTMYTATGSVELRSVNLSDAGVYAFQGNIFVSGSVEAFSGTVTLNVYELITNVNVKPSPAQPIANQSLNLTCEVLGSQTVSSRLWLKDGQPLSTSDRITLSVDNSVVSFNPVLQSDNGEYQCKASNPVSEVTSAGYRLEVYYGPEQVSITGPDQAVLNSSVTFTCSAQSLPPCNYTWYFNETETAQESQYKIASVSNADSGSYTCVAWNSVTGRNTSAVKKLIVTDKEESTGLGSLSSGEIAGIVIGTLAGVTGVALGVYFSVKLCRNNPHDLKPGPAQSKLITNVNVKPSLAQPIANQALNLTCEGLGSQTVSSRLWLKDGQPLSTSDRITLSVDSSVVSFNPVLQSDNGEYQCKASNPVSEVTSAGYRLEVYYGPEQVSITGPDHAVLNSSVTFTCSAQSSPPCNYTWYFNGTETAQGSQYKIASFSNADRGSYTCVSWNSVTGRNTSAVKEFTVTGEL
ncbi:UNVERIFIED_CONTAM: hypothetical protein FKN15_063471 [Acipenser sinensis]